jgi:hypothetical protein
MLLDPTNWILGWRKRALALTLNDIEMLRVQAQFNCHLLGSVPVFFCFLFLSRTEKSREQFPSYILHPATCFDSSILHLDLSILHHGSFEIPASLTQ